MKNDISVNSKAWVHSLLLEQERWLRIRDSLQTGSGISADTSYEEVIKEYPLSFADIKPYLHNSVTSNSFLCDITHTDKFSSCNMCPMYGHWQKDHNISYDHSGVYRVIAGDCIKPGSVIADYENELRKPDPDNNLLIKYATGISNRISDTIVAKNGRPSKHTVIAVSGARQVGKTSFIESLYNVGHVKLSTPLTEHTLNDFKIRDKSFEEIKDTVIPVTDHPIEFRGDMANDLTYREYLKKYIDPLYTDKIVPIAANAIRYSRYPVVMVDIGQPKELEDLIKLFPNLIHIKLKRNGVEYKSRPELYAPRTVTVHNLNLDIANKTLSDIIFHYTTGR